ncbi:SDR family oxidoreductase [Litorivicinus sp.]|nr:SDR family oxidoreductase [Litorivicinus sp.]
MLPSSDHSKVTIIFAVSSDIGFAIASSRLEAGWTVFGTYRNWEPKLDSLTERGATLYPLDMIDHHQIKVITEKIKEDISTWDELIVASGSLEPIDSFCKVDINEWINSININFTSQLMTVRCLLDRRTNSALLVFFAGGGTNGASDDFSAYTVSKIALIKMVELLDSELPDLNVISVGPGWVKTKIHQQTLLCSEAGESAKDETLRRLESDEFVDMREIVLFFDWLWTQDKSLLSGRNLSIANDGWRQKNFSKYLSSKLDFGKLRRFGNYQLNEYKEKN